MPSLTNPRCIGFFALCCAVMFGVRVQADSPNFNQDIRPILSNHCFACHGPDEEHRIADVRLDVADEVDLDEVLDRIVSDDPDYVMPPPEMNKPLRKDQIQKLRTWINDGAIYQQHWSFAPLVLDEGKLASVSKSDWSEQPIDRFVENRLIELGLSPSSRADKRTLIRRLSFDLTGLPPTVPEVHRFINDDSDRAYEDLVERLLSRPQYGEHMARYWLDLVRFADTNGLHHDHYREMTPYRDWVIRSFNENLPYDEFTKAQIAGDLGKDPTVDQQIASGFNRLHLIIDVGTALPEESFMRNVVDRVSAVGTAFLGLTLECAVCHDHKYDPITQRDFYQMYAFFNNFDGTPETGRRGTTDFKRGLQAPYIEFPTPEQSRQRESLQSELDATNANVVSLRQKLQQQKKAANNELEIKQDASSEEGEPVDATKPDVQPSSMNQIAETKAELDLATESAKSLRKKLEDLLLTIPATLVMKERSDPRPAHIMIRGNYDQPGEVVQRGTPDFLPTLRDPDGQPDRMDLAEWLVDAENPLTARVAVNRIWQNLFGVGLVRTSEDFGAQGERPSHPDLLDYLAIRFIEDGWDVKALIREIVLSETYRQSSNATSDQYEQDPENRLLARGSRYRLDAEMIRDQVLSVTGLLNPSLFGRSVKTPQPEGIWKTVAMPSSYPRVFQPDTGDKIYRRSVYSFWKRGLPPPQMTIFDAPSREKCIARRERTNTPLQALVLMNEQEYFRAASRLAESLLHDGMSDDARLASIHERMTSRLPTEAQLTAMRRSLMTFRGLYDRDPGAASEVAGDADADDRVELAAWTMMVHSMLNLDATRTRE